MGLSKRMLNIPDVDIAELNGSGDVRGSAVKAIISEVMPSWSRKGDALVQVASLKWPPSMALSTSASVATSALPES
jgi:hypothetical protein